jgi:hypothetical protein
MSANQEVYYRYVDDWTGYDRSNPIVTLISYPVLRHTRCGVWIRVGFAEKFVFSDPRGRRFAYADEQKALFSYRIRKERQHHLLVHQIEATRVRMTQMGFRSP